jgi:hypothetical protein
LKARTALRYAIPVYGRACGDISVAAAIGSANAPANVAAGQLLSTRIPVETSGRRKANLSTAKTLPVRAARIQADADQVTAATTGNRS